MSTTPLLAAVAAAAMAAAVFVGRAGHAAEPGEAPPPPAVPPPPPEAPPPPDTPWLRGELKLQPRGIFIVNTAHNGGTLTPGSFAFYALPPAVSASQFYISPANTVLGFGLSGLSAGRAELSGGLDITLRSPAPLLSSNSISPQFYDVHIQLQFSQVRLILGQFPDILLPFVPDVANSFPSGYVPGAIGYVRPQIRADVRIPLSGGTQLLAKVSADQPIQTFDLMADNVGRQGGRPDGQARLSFIIGRGRTALLAWEGPFEIGVAGHTGIRRVTSMTTLQTQQFRTWSIAGDLRARLPTHTQIKARLWQGALLGDYAAGIFQTVDAGTGQAVRAWGFWAEIQQSITESWRIAVCYGRDDPRDTDLSPAARSLNQAAVANVFWDVSKKIGFALEASRWATTYVGQGTTVAWREDAMAMMRF
jgi:hypothetical protein